MAKKSKSKSNPTDDLKEDQNITLELALPKSKKMFSVSESSVKASIRVEKFTEKVKKPPFVSSTHAAMSDDCRCP